MMLAANLQEVTHRIARSCVYAETDVREPPLTPPGNGRQSLLERHVQ